MFSPHIKCFLRIINDKLFVNGKYQSQHQAPKLPALNMDEVIDTDLPDITVSDDISDADSVFTSYAAEVTDMKSVGTAVNWVLLKPRVSSSTHMIYAYRFTDDSGITTDNFCSDGDYGLGLELLKLMRESDNTNVVCVTTRTCSPDYVHLGRKRFQYVRDTAIEAIKKLSDKHSG